MKKIALFFSVTCLLCACATIQTIEKKRAAGDIIATRYDYNWEEVASAIKYIIRHSERPTVSMRSKGAVIDYEPEERAMWLKYVFDGTIDMGIFFVPLDPSKTKVEFVKGGFTGSAFREQAIEIIIDESKFYLNHNGIGYKEYTHSNHLKAMGRAG
jgi:hypothetical protein